MKIILAVSSTNKYYGIPKYFYLLANELNNLGINVELIIDSDKIDIVKEFTKVKVTSLKPLVKNNSTTMQYCWNLNKYLLKQDFDILHTAHVLPFFYLMNKNRKPVVFQPFGNELFTLYDKGINKLQCKLGQPILRYCGHMADILLAEGKFQWNDMVKWYDNEKNMRILPVGIDTNKFKIHKPYSNKLFTFLSVNSLTKYDRIDYIIKAFKMFYNNINSRLIIVGSGEMEYILKLEAKDYPITFLKEITEAELINLYSTSDCYVSATSETDMQMGELEAMASGLPIIKKTGNWISCSGYPFMPKLIANEMFTVFHADRAALCNKSIEEVKQYDFKNIGLKALEIYKELA